MCTKFGVDSSSRFPFKARTNRETNKQTDATERHTHAGGYTAGVVITTDQIVRSYRPSKIS